MRLHDAGQPEQAELRAGPLPAARTRRWSIAVSVAVVLVRVVQLTSKPGEWYGDISTLYEYTQALGNGHVAPGWYVVGVGPLYPSYLRPFLWLLGDSYLTIKIASVAGSLLGLWLLYRLAVELVDRELAVLAVAVGGFMSWWLVYSRLGDLQGLTPTLALGAAHCTVLAIRRPQQWSLAVTAGAFSALGVYLYGNVMVLPLIVAVAVVVAWRMGRVGVRTVGLVAASGLVVLLPIMWQVVADPDVVVNGHVGRRFVGWSELAPALLKGYPKALWAYVGEGDAGFRGNVMLAPHIDHLCLAFALAGLVWWLRGPRRRQGLYLVGTFLLLHLPSVLAGTAAVPSASRTTAAAPFVALFAASGIRWAAGAVARWRHAWAAPFTVASVVALAVLGVHQYFWRYVPGLPYGNTPIAGEMSDYVDTLPAGTTVYLVGVGWHEGMPEVKSVRFQSGRGEWVVEEPVEQFDCDRLGQLARPAVLLWHFAHDLPAEGLEPCAGRLGVVELHVADNGRPVFRSAELLP